MVGDILQPTHLLFVLVVALLVLGPKRLPEVGRTLGNGIRDFRSAINGESNDRDSNDRHEEIDSQAWHSEPEPEEKHEFAHDGETTPESHEFAHEATVVSTGPSGPAPAQPAAPAQPEAPAPRAGASGGGGAGAAPGATSDTPAASDKHQFAHEAAEPAENPAGPRS
jgi:sec-independent protein translocase protein TatA